MRDKQFERIEFLLAGISEHLDSLNQYALESSFQNQWCIERMKRLDHRDARREREHALDRVRHAQYDQLNADRIAEMRAREASYDKARRNELKDAFIRSGLWAEMEDIFHAVEKSWPKDRAKD